MRLPSSRQMSRGLVEQFRPCGRRCGARLAFSGGRIGTRAHISHPAVEAAALKAWWFQACRRGYAARVHESFAKHYKDVSLFGAKARDVLGDAWVANLGNLPWLRRGAHTACRRASVHFFPRFDEVIGLGHTVPCRSPQLGPVGCNGWALCPAWFPKISLAAQRVIYIAVRTHTVPCCPRLDSARDCRTRAPRAHAYTFLKIAMHPLGAHAHAPPDGCERHLLSPSLRGSLASTPQAIKPKGQRDQQGDGIDAGTPSCSFKYAGVPQMYFCGVLVTANADSQSGRIACQCMRKGLVSSPTTH